MVVSSVVSKYIFRGFIVNKTESVSVIIQFVYKVWQRGGQSKHFWPDLVFVFFRLEIPTGTQGIKVCFKNYLCETHRERERERETERQRDRERLGSKRQTVSSA